jgi:hypothetical protein
MKIKLFEKDEYEGGYNIILNDEYEFADGTQSEHVENQKELTDFLNMVIKK